MTKRPLPKGWRWEKLLDVTEIIMGQSPPSNTYRKEPEGLPFFQGKADFGDKHPVARNWCVEPSRIAKAGDILLSVRAPVGPTNIADVDCCIGRGLTAIRPTEKTDRDFILFALKFYENDLVKKGSGSTFEAIRKEVLHNLEIPLPSLEEQKRIAARLDEQMRHIEGARLAAEESLSAARELPSAYLNKLFTSSNENHWKWTNLEDVCDLLPAKTIKSIGNTTVTAITTACLTENGFSPDGLKTARMDENDAKIALVKEGEILVARSNTPDLVGRVSMYPGTPPNVVASDLTIRVWAKSACHPSFLTAYLSYLYLSGYWKERAGGASGSMKKITRSQLLETKVPVSDMETQKRIVHEMQDKMHHFKKLEQALESQLAEIESLPSAVLGQAFAGQL